MGKLDDLLGDEEKQLKGKTETTIVQADNLDAIKVSAFAFDKAFEYARLACKIAGDSIECGGYLISPRGNPGRVALDAYLAHDQVVGGADYNLNAMQVRAAGKYLSENGYKILGWWHSHGSNMDTFHSGTDKRNQMTVLNVLSPFNFVEQDSIFTVSDMKNERQGDVVVCYDENFPSTRFELPARVLSRELDRLTIKKKERIGFTYSLVVNAKGSASRPYAEIATHNLSHEDIIDNSRVVPISVFPSPGQFLDEDQMAQEVKERISKRTFFSLGPKVKIGKKKRGKSKNWYDYSLPHQSEKITPLSEIKPQPIASTEPVEPINKVEPVTPQFVNNPGILDLASPAGREIFLKSQGLGKFQASAPTPYFSQFMGHFSRNVNEKAPSMLEKTAGMTEPLVINARGQTHPSGNWTNYDYKSHLLGGDNADI